MRSTRAGAVANGREGSPRQGVGFIHCNAAGAAKPADCAHNAMVSHLEREREIGGYAAAAERGASTAARVAIARLVSCDPDEIALTESAQSAWARAFTSLDFRRGDRIICWESEYAGNAVAMIEAQERTGAILDILPMTRDGVADLDALTSALDAHADRARSSAAASAPRAVVALTHVQTDSSIVQPAAQVGALAKEAGALFLLDACQSVGQMAVDVRAIGCHFMCGTGRKWLRGPRGSGFLFASSAALRHALVGAPAIRDHAGMRWLSRTRAEPRGDARRFEMWEGAEAARAGLAVACDACCAAGPARIHRHAARLASRLRAGLAKVPGLVQRDGGGAGAIVCFEIEGAGGPPASAVCAALLDRHGIAASVSPPTHTFSDGLWDRPSVVRLSPHIYNTEEEMDRIIAAVASIAKG